MNKKQIVTGLLSIALCSGVVGDFVQASSNNRAVRQENREETLNVQDDLGRDVDIMVHILDDNRLIPTTDDSVIGAINEGGHRYRCLVLGGGPCNALLSYRHNGKLYQRVVSRITRTTTILLSSFVEQPEDNYCFGVDNGPDYTPSYCQRLAHSIQDVFRRQS